MQHRKLRWRGVVAILSHYHAETKILSLQAPVVLVRATVFPFHQEQPAGSPRITTLQLVHHQGLQRQVVGDHKLIMQCRVIEIKGRNQIFEDDWDAEKV